MLVVATDDFEVYHEVVTELRDRGVTFTTVEPGEALPERTTLVVTGPEEDVDAAPDEEVDARPDEAVAAGPDDGVPPGVEVVRATPGDPRRAVEEALALLRGGEGRTVVGVDPGDRPGIAVLHGDVVVAVHQVPLEDATAVVRREIEGAANPLVRVGDGARLASARIVNDLEDVRVELVDETGTTPYLGRGVRESGDVLAAVNIARLEGEVVESREVEPTAGELRVIQDRAREQSSENRAITEALARRVATGELTVREALEEHREE